MEAFYYILFALLAAAAAALELGKGGASRGALAAAPGNAVTREFGAFRSNYVLVYALMMGVLLDRWEMARAWGCMLRVCALSAPVAAGGRACLHPVKKRPHLETRARYTGPALNSRSSHLSFHPPAGDWLQGPYVYALYQHYGFDRGDIGRLFIAGFASSMVFGTIVGSLADRTCVFFFF